MDLVGLSVITPFINENRLSIKQVICFYLRIVLYTVF